jgi:DNA polymerase-3 subunit gamma/tau
VEVGTSYDVLELDAASNNGVQEIRDIIDAAALSSPGRHRVFILDEVHMLTRAAEAALLKTLEEPPAQVVFVLATTDPQKVSETIRSRVQHLQFHLLPIDELEKYVRFVIEKAELDVDNDSIAMVLRQGGGSARDTLSALELVAAGGGEPEDAEHVEDIVRAIIARDHSAALTAVAKAMQQGRDAHTYAEDIVRLMRDCFLSIMSPELVMLPAARVTEINAYARELGVQRIVRVMETLGSTMVEMRHAPDSRLLLEVAIVQLSSPVFDDSNENLLARISQLEEAVKQLKENGVAAALPPPPLNPSTGRAKIGGRASHSTQETPRDASTPTPRVEDPSVETPAPVAEPDVAAPTDGVDPAQAWPQITDSLKGLAKALFKPAVVESFDGKKIVVRMPANTPLQRAHEREAELVAAIKKVCGVACSVQFNQADATGGMERPVLNDAPEKPDTIDKIVEKDPFAAIDINETVSVNDAPDALMEALQNSFPQGSVVDDDTSPTEL